MSSFFNVSSAYKEYTEAQVQSQNLNTHTQIEVITNEVH